MKEQMLHTFAGAHERLLTIATVVERQANPHNEVWGACEILAHVAAWEAEALHRIPLLAAGAPAKQYDTNAFNTQAVEAINDQSFMQVRQSLCQTHQQLVSMLTILEDSNFAPGGSAYEWITAQIQHSNEHAMELEKRI